MAFQDIPFLSRTVVAQFRKQRIEGKPYSDWFVGLVQSHSVAVNYSQLGWQTPAACKIYKMTFCKIADERCAFTPPPT